ncbi:sn-glycerol-3-phosphate ABC transporter ATP-binding protein UgpC [Clostridium oceanicum]|uniref:Sn-glycerol-3-phosphate ABC transporter ATP-binding protein UgpC n=1 Tax=Clostridium oceanicum TaxID=1543 RepID=A0ABN1JFR6_9CLOT
MSNVELKNVYKTYDSDIVAVNDFNLKIEDKEFIVFVGPSGCGKSTTLRMIAGLEEISKGEIYIDEDLVNDVPSKERDIAMVFQNYALYPHMSVYENMAFGLKLRKTDKKETDRKVKEVAKILDIQHLLKRKPKALSGGQKQRVAIGRAIVRNPKVFLMDEPLSNLDAKLRVQMRTEIIKLFRKLETTFIYVTHDQVEAMTMGTRIVVMDNGIIKQVDTPEKIYDSPANIFVASFIGSPQMNLLDATIESIDDELYVAFDENKIKLPKEKAKILKDNSYIGKEVTIGIRPEHINEDRKLKDKDCMIKSKVEVIEHLGAESYIYTVCGKKSINVRVLETTKCKIGQIAHFYIEVKKLHIFDKETGNRIV